MISNVRYCILVLSVIAITLLVGNLLLFNALLAYPHANHLLPEQFKVSPEIPTKNIDYIRNRRSTDSRPYLERNQKSNSRGKTTTAHPILVQGSFLDVQPIQDIRTTRTRRTNQPKGPAKILTNLNVRVETTTILQRGSASSNKNKNFHQTDRTVISSDAKKAPEGTNNVSVGNASNLVSGNSTLFERDWSQFVLEAFVFATPGLGMLVGYIPLSLVLRRRGSRIVMASALAFSAFFLAIQMKLISFGVIYVCVLRFFHGLTCAPLLTFIGINSAQWATLKEQLSFLTFSFSSIMLAPALSWFLVYMLIDSHDLLHLQILHYVLAGSTIVVALLWLVFYRDSPQKHPLVNGVELNRIVTGKTQNNRAAAEHHAVPTLLLKSVSTWSIIIASFVYFGTYSFMAIFLPVYSVTVLQTELSLMTSGTFVSAIVCHLICIAFNKLLCGCSDTLKIRSFNTFGFLLAAAIHVVIAALPPDVNFVETIRFVLLLVLLPMGFTTLGFIYSSVIYGRFFTQYIVSNMQLPFSLAMTVVPLFVVFLTVDNALRYWRITFLVMGILLVLASVVFGILVRGYPASWAESSWNPNASYKMHNVDCVSRTEECGLLELRRLDCQNDIIHNEH